MMGYVGLCCVKILCLKVYDLSKNIFMLVDNCLKTNFYFMFIEISSDNAKNYAK